MNAHAELLDKSPDATQTVPGPTFTAGEQEDCAPTFAMSFEAARELVQKYKPLPRPNRTRPLPSPLESELQVWEAASDEASNNCDWE